MGLFLLNIKTIIPNEANMTYKVTATIFIFLLLASCASVRKYDLVAGGKLLSGGLHFQPGAAAWSSDSKQLAVIKDNGLRIIDTASGMSKTIPGIKPVFIDWAPGNDLLVVNKADGMNELAVINADDGTIKTVSARKSLIAAKWLDSPGSCILFDSEIKQRSIGTFVTYGFTKLDKGKEEVFFYLESYLPTRKKGVDAVSGWTYTGIRPLHDTALILEFRNPPVFEPFTLFKTADPLITEETLIAKLSGNRFSIPSSWSPDGSRLAVTDDKGLLIIIDLDKPENLLPVSPDISGRYPAWNPLGSQIYLGGWLLRSDGSVLEQIVSDAFDSIGVWSPDGTRLAVIAGTNLLYFNGFSPSFSGRDIAVSEGKDNIRDKLRLIKKLLKDGLISDEEFKARRTKLFSK
jgi:WD40 repeat protein